MTHTRGKRSWKLVAPALLSVMLSALVTQSAFADPRDFTLENDSPSYIDRVYISASNSSYWGYDVLHGDGLAPGYQEAIRFNRAIGDTCYYDILIVNDRGLRTRRNAVNLCAVDVEYYTE